VLCDPLTEKTQRFLLIKKTLTLCCHKVCVIERRSFEKGVFAHQMLDKYERDINYLRVSITDRCNLRCTYCRPKEGIALKGHEDILRYEQILRVIGQAVKMGFIKVRITGGEPLVRRGFVEFVQQLKKTECL
jgi:MoaA/NifB/PqqE/SkfB family radical SAM enzyme